MILMAEVWRNPTADEWREYPIQTKIVLLRGLQSHSFVLVTHVTPVLGAIM